MKRILLRRLNKLLSKAGYRFDKIERMRSKPNDNSMELALLRINQLGLQPTKVVDVGAAKGSWTKLAMKYWPDSQYVLFEPLVEQIEMIPPDIKSSPNCEIVQAVASNKNGVELLTIADDMDGSGLYGGVGKNVREVPEVILDDFISEHDHSIILKLDTHGFEIPIFEGANKMFACTEAIIVEVYGFYVSPQAKLFHQVSEYLFQHGFRLFDVVDVMRRKKDNAFWQADAIFLRSDNHVFQNNTYQI